MSPIEEYQHGHLARALTAWQGQLAAGRSWTEVEAEIISCCDGRVDLLTGLLIEAETGRSNAAGARLPTSGPRRVRRAVPAARRWHEPQPDRAVLQVSGVGHQS